MKKTVVILMVLMWAAVCVAQENDCPSANGARHEIRVGYGDDLISASVGHFAMEVAGSGSSIEDDQVFYGTFSADYFYRIDRWVKVGGKFVFNHGTYSTGYVDGEGHVVINSVGNTRTALWVMPSVKVVYYTSDWVRLYSGISIGLNCRSDRDGDEFGLGWDATVLGVSVGKYRWFADFELGGLMGTTPLMSILPARIVSLSVGYRF